MSETLEHTHPIPAALHGARSSISAVDTVEPLFMTPEQIESGLRELMALKAQTAELEARLMSAADVVLDDARSWLTVQTRTGAREARALIRTAHATQAHPAVAAGMRAGDVSAAQAEVIIRAIDALPGGLDPTLVARAESQLIRDAAAFDPRQLRALGHRILELIAPGIAEAAEEEALRRQEQRARERTRLTLKRLGDGSTRISGLLPDIAAARLAAFLDGLLNPRRTPPWADTSKTTGDDADSRPWWSLPGPTKLGEAFCELLERIDPATLPVHGRSSTGILITMELAKLQTGIGAAILQGPDGEIRVSASETRRLACQAGLVPVVLGTRSEVLDLGRTARLFSSAQSKALMVRHQTCRTRGCDVPATWTEVHHLTPWSQGGRTDLKDGVLFCHHDHDRAHSPDWVMTMAPDGLVDFTRR